MRTALLAPIIFLAMFVLAAACLGERTACAQEEDIVSVIPWSDGEQAEYVLLDREDGQSVDEPGADSERGDPRSHRLGSPGRDRNSLTNPPERG